MEQTSTAEIGTCLCLLEDLEAMRAEAMRAEDEPLVAMAPAEKDAQPAHVIPTEDDPALRLLIGRYLGNLRKKKGVTQRAAARRMGISRPHLSNIEQGKARTGWQILAKIAGAYRLTIQQVIKQVEEEGINLGDLAAEAHSLSWSIDNPGSYPLARGLTPYDTYMLGLFRILSPERRRDLRKYAARLVIEQGDEAG